MPLRPNILIKMYIKIILIELKIISVIINNLDNPLANKI
jgi:hypothetical protein